MPAIAAEDSAFKNPPLHVAVGVIRGPDDTVLIALRAAHLHQGGLWEFPGGKVEEGESVSEALSRELQEELGIVIGAAQPLCRIAHEYPERSVLLDVWSISQFDGEPRGLQQQPLRWVPVGDLRMEDFPVANRAIIRRLQLPPLIAVTGQEDDEQAFCNRFEQVLAQGIKMVQLRAPALYEDEFRARALRCAHLCSIYDAKLLLNAEPELVAETEADGFHASSARLMQLSARPVSDNHFFSASCHNLEQLQQAERLGVDFVLLSPVLETATHPEATPLGWERFRELAGAVSVPCYALGGVRPADLEQCLASGGVGIAAVGAFW